METVQTTRFDRIENSQLGKGETVEYRNNIGETIAYIDYSEDKTEAAVTVFNPYKAGERRYSRRPVLNAEKIVANHLTKNGMTAKAGE